MSTQKVLFSILTSKKSLDFNSRKLCRFTGMIYRVFKSNFPLVTLLLLPVLVVFSLPEWLSPSENLIENTGPIFGFIYSSLGSTSWVSYLAAYVLILTTAILFNRLINKNELFARHTFLPSLIYVVAIGAFPQLVQFHPVILGNFILVLALRRLFEVKRDFSAAKEVFDGAFLIALAALIYPPYTFLFLITWITLAVIRPFVWREWVLALLGFTIPTAVTGVLFHITDYPEYLEFYENLTPVYRADIFTDNVAIRSAASSLFVANFIFAAYSVLSLFSGHSLRFKQLLTIFSFFGILNIVVMLYCRFFSGEEIYPAFIALPGTLFFTFYYQNNKNFLAPILFYLCIAFALVNIYFL